MKNTEADKQDSGKRICNRISLPRTVLVELGNGEILRGKSVDLSPRGVLFTLEAPTKTELPGLAATLFIISAKGEFSIGYPCKVVRHKDKSVALEIHKKSAAAFGNYLTKDLLGHSQEE